MHMGCSHPKWPKLLAKDERHCWKCPMPALRGTSQAGRLVHPASQLSPSPSQARLSCQKTLQILHYVLLPPQLPKGKSCPHIPSTGPGWPPILAKLPGPRRKCHIFPFLIQKELTVPSAWPRMVSHASVPSHGLQKALDKSLPRPRQVLPTPAPSPSSASALGTAAEVCELLAPSRLLTPWVGQGRPCPAPEHV